MDRHLPDAPQDSRYYGGRPTGEPDDVFTVRCPKCDLLRNPDEADANGLCPNCSPEMQLKQTSAQEITGIVSVLKYFNRRFGINE